MFQKNKTSTSVAKVPAGKQSGNKKGSIPSIITQGMHILGNMVSEGNVDFDGTLDGNIRCSTLTIRGNGFIKGDAVANSIFIYGRVRGLIRAKSVHLYASCNVEGVIMHEAITIEDGAFVDGKFKRTDRVQTEEEDSGESDFSFDEESDKESDTKILENIRLIR